MWLQWMCLVVLWFGASTAGKDFLSDLPMQNPDLFLGDILGVEDPDDRNAVVIKRQLWEGGVVAYELDPGIYSTVPMAVMKNALWYYGKETSNCIKFVPRTNEENYVRIFPGQGCYSHVGKTWVGAQPLSLGKGCGFFGTVLHELSHAVGFYHEQNRSDRDDWLTIFWENIKEGTEPQFMKLKPEQNQLLTPFDYDSIMLYGSYTFSKDYNKLMTMVGKKGNKILKNVAWKSGFSKSDVKRIKMLYNCPN